MPILSAFIIYLIAGMGISAILTPWIQPFLESVLHLSPDRGLYRFAMLLGLIGMPFFLRALQLRGRQAMGFTLPQAQAWQAIFWGLLIGAMILAGLFSLLLWTDARTIKPEFDSSLLKIVKVAVSGLLSGLAVGLIEEFFFRGPMQTGMRRSLSFWPSAILIGMFYAAVHFIRPGKGDGGEYDQSAAFNMMLEGYANLANFSQFADSFIGLMIAGIFLSMVRERTGNILWAIGIHAGWVMIIKLGKYFSSGNSESLWIGPDSLTGWMSSLWMGVIALIYWWWSNPARKA